KKLRRTYRQLKNVPTNLAIEKKLAAKLWKLGKDYGLETSEGVLIDLPLSVMYISQLLGSQRETVSRAIKKLVELDLVKYENKKMVIVNQNALAKYFKS
ncbi:MAG: helix-turn-helix domain-containing protein, partial [Turicibacter sp.]